MAKPELTEEDKLRINDHMVEGLRQAVKRGLSHLPEEVLNVITTGAWQKRYIEKLGKHAGFDSFKNFVEAAPLDGIGGDLIQLKRACAHRRDVLSAITHAAVGKQGAPEGNQNNASGVNQYTTQDAEDRRTTYDNITDCPPPEYVSPATGTSNTYALRKLRKDREDLHGRVLAGEISPHAAMVKAGFRKKTGAFYPEDINRTARVLLNHFDPDELIEALVKLKRAHREYDEAMSELADRDDHERQD